jgi:hypothetical protein
VAPHCGFFVLRQVHVHGREPMPRSQYDHSTPCFKRAWDFWYQHYLGGLDLAPDVDSYLAGDVRMCARRKHDPLCQDGEGVTAALEEVEGGHGGGSMMELMKNLGHHHRHPSRPGNPKYMLQPGEEEREAPAVKASAVIMNWKRPENVKQQLAALTSYAAIDEVSSLGDAKSSLGDAESSLGDAESSLGDAKSSLGDAESSLGDAESSLGDAESSLGDA